MKKFTVWILSLMMVFSLLPCISFAGVNDNEQEQNQDTIESDFSEVTNDDETVSSEKDLSADGDIAVEEEESNNTSEQPVLLGAENAASMNTFQVQDRVSKLILNYNNTYFTNVNGVYGQKDPNSNTYHRNYYCKYCDVTNVIKTSKVKSEYPSGVTSGNMPAHYDYYGGSYSLGDSCCGFGSFAGFYIFGNGKNKNVSNSRKYRCSFTQSNYKSIKANLKIGDIVRFDRSHSAVYLGIDSSGMKVIDSNYWYYSNGTVKGVCYVRIHNVPFSAYSKIAASRGTNATSVPSRTPVVSTNYSGIKVAWNSVPGADGYYVYRATSSTGSYTKIKTTSSTSFIDTSVASGKTYYYKIKSYNKCRGGYYYSVSGSAKAGKWNAAKCTIKYDANGGTGAPASQTKVQKSTLKLSGTVPTRSGYGFVGWATNPKATTAEYFANGNYTVDKEGVSSTTLYAVWKDENDLYFSKVSLSPSSIAYDGIEHAPTTVKVIHNGNVLSEGIDYNVTKHTGKNVGTYTVVVRGVNKYCGTKTATFKINPRATKIKSITSRKAGFAVVWYTQSSQVSGYQIQYSRSKSFSSPKLITVKGASLNSKIITKLTRGKYYYVRVRTYHALNGKYYYSSWSSYRSVKTK